MKEDTKSGVLYWRMTMSHRSHFHSFAVWE